jgi:hypothetical protein
LESHTARDINSIEYRNNLNQLEFDLERFVDVVDERIAEKTGENQGAIQENEAFALIAPSIYPVSRLVNKKGRVFRDKTNRLHSPFTQLYKGYRECFTVDGERLACLDMKAAQPTLLGLMSGDQKLVEHCVSDILYQQIAQITGTDRDMAKRNYCWFAYGAIKEKETVENRPVFEIQNLFEREYPTAFAFIKQQKSTNYRTFSHQMMRAEAAIFIDGVFRELTKEGIFALTIHDSVFFKENDPNAQNLVEEIIARQIHQQLPSTEDRNSDKLFKLSYSAPFFEEACQGLLEDQSLADQSDNRRSGKSSSHGGKAFACESDSCEVSSIRIAERVM